MAVSAGRPERNAHVKKWSKRFSASMIASGSASDAAASRVLGHMKEAASVGGLNSANRNKPRAERSDTSVQALTMRRMYSVIKILAVIAVPTITSSAVQAEVVYPWCAWTGGAGPRESSSATDCGFVSWSHCMATARNMEFCEPNPLYFSLCKRNCGQPYSETAVRSPIKQQWPRPAYAPN
jgi:hypothetical protein